MRPLGLALVVSLLGNLASAQETHAAPSATRLDFRESPVVDLFFLSRALAADASAEVPPALAAAVKAAHELNGALGGAFLAWGPVAGLLPGCDKAADVTRAFAELPETFEVRPGTSLKLREHALALAAALEAAEPTFLAEIWPRHREEIGAAHARLAEGFAPKEAACFAFHLEKLGMKDPGLSIPVYLTVHAPFPGAVTYRGVGGRGVCFVSVSDAEGSQLFETALHEATHALDVALPGASVLEDLRARLEKVGLGPRDAVYRDLPHTLMFVQAAESIRSTVDPKHEDYGVVSRYYERAGPLADAVRGLWRDHLEGRLTRDEALDGLVEAAVAPK